MTTAPPTHRTGQGRDGGVGLVGAGFIAHVHRAALVALAAETEQPTPTVIAIADVNSRAAQELAARWPATARATDVAALLHDPQVHTVVICTPNTEHRRIAEEALALGKHVVCDKPLAATLDDAAAMNRAAAEADSRAAVSFVFRSWPVIERARALIIEGELGKPFSFNGHMYHGYGLARDRLIGWRTEASAAGGGAVVDVGSHIIDIAQYLMGDITSVSARLHQVVPQRVDVSGRVERSTVDDAAAMLVDFADGSVGSIRASWAAAGYGSDVRFEVLGSRGSLSFTWQRRDELRLARMDGGAQTLLLDAAGTGARNFWSVPGLGVGYHDAFVSFYRKLFSPDPHSLGVASFDEAYSCHTVVDAARRSDRAGGTRMSTERQLV